MPSDWLYIDTNFPTFTGEENLEEKISTIQNYTFMLVEQLRYTLNNLDMTNFNQTAVVDWSETITEPITVRLENDEGAITALQASFDGITLVASAGDDYSMLTLKSGETVLSSANIKFNGTVTFTALSSNKEPYNYTQIKGSNISTGNILSMSLQSNYIGGTLIDAGAMTGTLIMGANIIGGTITAGGTPTMDTWTLPDGTEIQYIKYLPVNGTYAQMDANGFYTYDNYTMKTLLGNNPNLLYDNQSLVLGADNSAYVTKYYDTATYTHKMWIGNGLMSCGIMFDFTNGTYQLMGLPI